MARLALGQQRQRLVGVAGAQLHGGGVVVQDLGALGHVAKLQAYQLQDGGRDTVDANLELGLPADARHYGTATQILRDLGVTSVRLLTNNPEKTSNLEEYGVTVAERVPLAPRPNDHNIAYLLTKRDRMGHQLDGLDGYPAPVPPVAAQAVADEADLVVDPPRVDPVTHDPGGNATVPHDANDQSRDRA